MGLIKKNSYKSHDTATLRLSHSLVRTLYRGPFGYFTCTVLYNIVINKTGCTYMTRNPYQPYNYLYVSSFINHHVSYVVLMCIKHIIINRRSSYVAFYCTLYIVHYGQFAGLIGWRSGFGSRGCAEQNVLRSTNFIWIQILLFLRQIGIQIQLFFILVRYYEENKLI